MRGSFTWWSAVTASFVFVLMVSSSLVLASEGDHDVDFETCLSKCERLGCKETSPVLFGLLPSWTCEQECKYNCMWEIENQRRHEGKPARQYYGKWPFKRVWGIQEPLSTFFSLLNAIPHIYEILFRRQYLAPKGMDPTLRFLSLLSCGIAINTWVWSMAFHGKDNWFNERMDYHFATLHMLFYLWFAICRVAWTLDPTKLRVIAGSSGFVLLAMFLRHIWYMNFVVFDYGWNMKVTGFFVVTQLLVWIVWASISLKKDLDLTHNKAKNVVWMIIRFQVLLICFAAFEAFDFPPLLDFLDAHAVWHGLTPPLGFYWYMFREADAKIISQKVNAHSV
jgi:post-GPI attachment to proteins factor 3